MKIEVGDIVKVQSEAIVSPTNNSLLPKGELDRHIHKAAGPELVEACKAIGSCETGDAKITDGYRLEADYVIHTVGPFYSDEDPDGAEELLKSCYIKSLDLAKKKGIKSIAFPLISTGAKGFPLKVAVPITINAIRGWKADNIGYELDITIVCNDEKAHEAFKGFINW